MRRRPVSGRKRRLAPRFADQRRASRRRGDARDVRAARERLLRASRDSAFSSALDASAEDGAGDAEDADFFETTAELDDDASGAFVSAPSTPSAIAKAFDWKGGESRDVDRGNATSEATGSEENAATVEGNVAPGEATVGGLLAVLSDPSASDPGEDVDDAHLDVFFAARAAEEDSDGEADEKRGDGKGKAVVPEKDEVRGLFSFAGNAGGQGPGRAPRRRGGDARGEREAGGGGEERRQRRGAKT